MTASANNQTVEALIDQGAWDEARQLIERELSEQSDNHWLLTQLGVTHYEQGRYREALRPLLESLEIVPDCPLTLWNLAGALAALGKSEKAIAIYSWLLGSKKTAEDDPCWESDEWTDALKTDCVFRVGVCFQQLGNRESAENCFRQYVNLLLAGRNGMYSLEEAAKHIRELHGNNGQLPGKEARAAIGLTLQDSGIRLIQGGRRKLPKLSLTELLAT